MIHLQLLLNKDEVRQAKFIQQYQDQRRLGRFINSIKAIGRGRRQTERISKRQAWSVRQAANDQRRINSPGNTRVITHRKTLGNVSSSQTRLRNEGEESTG